MTYAILHAHDTYGSIGDSILRIDDYVEKAKQLNIKQIAITNHGSLATMVDFYETCKANNIDPIIGCEFYYTDDIKKKDKQRYHLILLAKNNDGLKNLIRLHNIAGQEGFYYKPRIDFTLLEQYHEGLICLSACVAGKIPQLILQEYTLVKAITEANKFKNLFGRDFYLEIQPGHFYEQECVNSNLVQISRYCDIPLVATNDVHYLNADDWIIHDYHVKDSRKMRMDDAIVYPDTCYYVMPETKLVAELSKTIPENIAKEAVANTLIVAEQCHATLPEEKYMPCFDPKIDEEKTLSDLCWHRLKELENRLPDPAVYASRLQHELDTIHTLGFDGYFLIVKDIVNFCDQNKIPRGPGRGSAVGSLVSYLLNISVADPVKYNLMFERFLSADRKGIPDIDLDIDPAKRDLVYDHIIKRYGADHCCFVSTFNKRKARAAIKTAARILGQPVDIGDMLSKAVPYVTYDELGEKHTDMPLWEVLKTNEEFRKLAQNHMDIVNLAIKIEGYPSSTGIHPAGIVISPVVITDRYPLIRCNDKALHATSLDLNNVEKLSGVKFDLLALASLSVVFNTLQDAGITIDYTDDTFFQDKTTWDLIGSSYTTGLFQIASTTYKTRMPLLKPTSIPELVACLALVRGPCISSGADKKYIQIKQGTMEPEPICKEYWDITKDTCGIIIYQEQVLQICQALGMNSVDSYYLLKGCSKKKADKILVYEKQFSQSASAYTTSENITCIWNEIINSAKYAFNISHATAYAILCYVSAWLKVHYPLQYMCHVLNKVFAKPDIDTVTATVQECKRLGILFLEADINLSSWDFTVEGNKIRIGYCAIKGLGKKAYEHISSPIPYDSFDDFISRAAGNRCNKRSVQLLITAGLFSRISRTKPLTLLRDYAITKRKEYMPAELKVGKEIIKLSLPQQQIEKAIYGASFPIERRDVVA